MLVGMRPLILIFSLLVIASTARAQQGEITAAHIFTYCFHSEKEELRIYCNGFVQGVRSVIAKDFLCPFEHNSIVIIEALRSVLSKIETASDFSELTKISPVDSIKMAYVSVGCSPTPTWSSPDDLPALERPQQQSNSPPKTKEDDDCEFYHPGDPEYQMFNCGK